MMGIDGPAFSVSKKDVPSVKLGLFFNELIDKLKVHEEGRAKRFATESRKLARNALFMVLSNLAWRHPDLDLKDGFRKPPPGADVPAAEEKATPLPRRFLVSPLLHKATRPDAETFSPPCWPVTKTMMHVLCLDVVLFMLHVVHDTFA